MSGIGSWWFAAGCSASVGNCLQWAGRASDAAACCAREGRETVGSEEKGQFVLLIVMQQGKKDSW